MKALDEGRIGKWGKQVKKSISDDEKRSQCEKLDCKESEK